MQKKGKIGRLKFSSSGVEYINLKWQQCASVMHLPSMFH
jgi:hypothetical protein